MKEASEHWQAGRFLETGRLLYQRLPKEVRPKWAAHVLSIAVKKSAVHFPAIDYLLHIANDSREWGNAHRAFDALRDAVLDLLAVKARTDDQQLLLSLLALAEPVAKVIYNATGPSDPFDEDAGYWVAVCLKHVVDSLGDKSFSEYAWLALACHDEF